MLHDTLLSSLNPSQKAAVSSTADTLAILAGPGSGKTHTLTSRTVWLLQQGIQPWNIIVATFTVKAAREMKDRIGKLLGNGQESKLILGTFHSISRRYLSRYGYLIDIPRDFGIADSADSLAIIKRIVKTHRMNLDPSATRSRISTFKSQGPKAKVKTSSTKSLDVQQFELCSQEYEAALNRSNLLDYDDLLLSCAELLRAYPSCVANVEAVLIDEFQDTNLVQFDLMRLFAAYRKRVTIVGDPDQSIYGFRAAEVKNYRRMIEQYPETISIPLEENYRSSGAILLAALTVIQQDTSRPEKSLTATHTVGTKPVFRKLASAQNEAEWIVTEVGRCLGMTGNVLDLDDVVILLRSAPLSRLIEIQLGKAGVPYRMLGGLRFYDRTEVKTVLDYLRIIDQPGNNDALASIINVPSRGIGETTTKALLAEADASSITLWALILRFSQGNRASKTKLRKQAEKGLSSLVNIILTAQKKLKTSSEKDGKIVELIKLVLEKTSYEAWLRDHYNDAHQARWDNVQELITQAADFQRKKVEGYEDDALPYIDGLEQVDSSTSLSKFLANVALASRLEVAEDKQPRSAQITISTIHAAKGLEWPVVFIPAVYQGSIPHSRAEDANEERRLLYVAMTRAKALLYMSCPLKNSQGEQVTMSNFLSVRSLAPHLESRGPSFTFSTVQSLCQVLRRQQPSIRSIDVSSAALPSREDDLIKMAGEEGESQNRRWVRTDEDLQFIMGQQPAKRRRIELAGGVKKLPGSIYGLQHATTVDTTMAGFSTASSLYQAVESRPSCLSTSLMKPAPRLTSKNNKRIEGQGTLLGFLGKTERNIDDGPALSPADNSPFQQGKPRSDVIVSEFTECTMYNSPITSIGTFGIPQDLAQHRLTLPQKSGSRYSPARLPCLTADDDPQRRRNYCFLSSSPPPPSFNGAKGPQQCETSSQAAPEDEIEICAVRPAMTLHSINLTSGAQTGSSRGHNLGMRRTLKDPSCRRDPNRAFVSPCLRK